MVDREHFEFDSRGTTCRAWFYPAQNEAMLGPAGVPAIVMAHGLGGTRDAGLEPVWSGIGVHRAAEFNRGHVPAFLAGDAPLDYACVYPFVRSYEWYLLPDDERREMLREHGAAAKDYRDVLANTVASFALSDYEWLLAFESADLLRIVDLMRDLRATDARRHVREEIPFFTGPRVDPEELLRRHLR